MQHTVAAEPVASVMTVQVLPVDEVVVLESMTMEIPVLAGVTGIVVEVAVTIGDLVHEATR